jgi:hypothetical protein
MGMKEMTVALTRCIRRLSPPFSASTVIALVSAKVLAEARSALHQLFS